MPKIPETIDDIYAAFLNLGYAEIVERVHEWLHPLPPPGSTRVRIAVGFDGNDWIAHGSHDLADEDLIPHPRFDEFQERIVFVEADIPPREPEPVVRGRVVG